MDFLAPRRAAAIRIATHITSCKSGEQSSFLSTETLAPTGIPSSSGLLVISRAAAKRAIDWAITRAELEALPVITSWFGVG
jgi:hypothetical protein